MKTAFHSSKDSATQSLIHACAHCGEVCSDLDIKLDGRYFCCTGCRSVYNILQSHGLCDYYNRDNSGISMRLLDNAQTKDEHYLALDDKEIQKRLLSFTSPSRNRVIWTIPTLHCASCVWLLEQINRLDTGILSCTVDIMRKNVTVDYHPKETSLSRIANVLSTIGYAPLIRLEEADNESRREIATSSTRALYTRIGLAAFATANTMLMAFAQYLAGPETVGESLRIAFNWISIILSLPVLLYSASPWFTAARSSIRQKRISLDVPVAMGILALFVRSMVDIWQGTGEGYLDSFNSLVLLLLIGRLFQQKAFDALSFDRTYRSFFPLSVRVLRNGISAILPIEQVAIGDRLSIRNGEVIPCDSVLESETGYIDYSFVTGESVPVETLKGQTVHAGGQVVGRAVDLLATKKVSHSELAQMWDRTSKRTSRKTFLALSDTFGRWFTFFAIFFAIAGAAVWLPDWNMAFNVFTAVLIIACPCALTLAAPITLGTAMGRLGELGIYLRSIGSLLDLQRISAIFFDKTGTLTQASHELHYQGRPLSDGEWRAVRALASQSAHPVSRSLAHGLAGNETYVSNVNEVTGKGLSGNVGGEHLVLGSLPFVQNYLTEEESYQATQAQQGTTYLAINGSYAGSFVLKSRLRPGISRMIRTLIGSGMRIQIVTGDSDRDKDILLPFMGGDNLKFNCRPETKIEHIEEARSNGYHVLMVGDGLNDAGAMGAAEVAIAITDNTATLVPACDVIMRSNALPALPALVDYATSTKNVIVAAFIISIVYNALGLSLAIMGMLSPLAAAILMPISSLTVIAVSVFGARGNLRTLKHQLQQPSN